MGLFGDLDANDISDNPFYVAPDTYKCVLTEANLVEKKDGSGHGLSFKWNIDDEDSEYYGNSVNDWHNVFLDLTSDMMTEQRVRRAVAGLRARLTSMGLSADEQNNILDEDNLADLIGMVAYVSVKETTDKNDPDKKYTNVTKVVRIDE